MTHHTFQPGQLWNDTSGSPINAHQGGVIFHDGVYFWFGVDYGHGWEGRLAFTGVHCYSSRDLYNWKDEGLALEVNDVPGSPIIRGCRIERPKVVFNDQTAKFVMWWHSSDQDHTIAKSGVAIADKPTGPYQFLRAYRPFAGVWPVNVRPEQKDIESIRLAALECRTDNPALNGENDTVKRHNILGRDMPGGQFSRDMNLFKDDDGTLYHLYSSEHNSTLHIAEMDRDYLSHRQFARAFENRWMEGPAMFKRDGKYYLFMSGCTSWDPNEARSAIADHPFGPWTELGNPCRDRNTLTGEGPELTFGTQSTCVLKVEGIPNAYIAMMDDWDETDFISSRYVWLPITFEPDGSFTIRWRETWDLGVFDGSTRGTRD